MFKSNESNSLQLRLPARNSASQATEIVAEEKVEFMNGKVICGVGYIVYLDIFDSLMIEFGNYQKINTDTLSNGILKIDRNNSDMNIWNPFIMNYNINDDTQSPIHIEKFNDSFIFKLLSKSTHIDNLRLYIRIQDDPRSRARISLLPNNLSHAAKYEDKAKIIWKIEYPRYGSNYILSFSELNSNFSILSIEASYWILDELSSGLFVKNTILTKHNNNFKKPPVRYIKKSKIKEIFII